MTTDDLAAHLPVLLEQAGVAAVQIDVLTKRDSFQGAEISAAAQAITDPARDEHRRRGFGFWEFVLSESYAIDAEIRRGLIDGALRHNSAHTIHMSLSTDEFVRGLRAHFFSDLPERTIVSLSSCVATKDGDRRHLPMLDMGAPAEKNGAEVCGDVLKALGVAGQLYESGRSFHFIGRTLLEKRELLGLFARAQLLSPLVDARWISHQVIDDSAALRISTDVSRHTTRHRFVADV